VPTEVELNELRNGVNIILEGKVYKTLPGKAEIIPNPENLPPRKHPVGTHFATTWIKLTLIEGKFHQIRKMTAAINHQTMRLIRVSIEGIEIKEFIPEQIIEIDEAEFFKKLKISLP
jgi:23S rRNA pseudouridine2457 synthase